MTGPKVPAQLTSVLIGIPSKSHAPDPLQRGVWGAGLTIFRAAFLTLRPALAVVLAGAVLGGCSSENSSEPAEESVNAGQTGGAAPMLNTGGSGEVPPSVTGGGTAVGSGGAPLGAGGSNASTGGDIGVGGSGGVPTTTETGGAPATDATDILIEENELGFCHFSGVIEAEHTGFSGSGYVNSDEGVGQEISWSVATTGAPVTLSFRYATSGDRPAQLLVDDTEVEALAFPSTSEWTNWTDVSSSVSLGAGVHTITLRSTGASGLPNIDSLSLLGEGATQAECPEIVVEPPTTDLTSLVGFATENGGTTGGAGGPVVTVSSYTDLKSHAESSGAMTILVDGTITNGTAGGQIRVASNKSIIGLGDSAFLSGVGIDISDENNIIIQNLRVSLLGAASPSSVNGGDAISISGTSKNIWLDHSELFSENPSTQTDINLYDGLLDIKGQTGFITISWCHFHDHHKGGLVGAADDDLFADRKVTFHHNFYERVKLRVPMYRGSTGHFFNNYIVGAQDATEIRAGTCVRVERNYYEALHYSIYTPSDAPGSTERIDNIEVSRTSRAYPGNCTANIGYDYALALTTNTEDVKTVVPAFAGVGKLP